MRIFYLIIAISASIIFPSASFAGIIKPIWAKANSEYPGYSAQYSIDGNYHTDWAANGTGSNSYIDFNLGGLYSLTGALITDRTTSGPGVPNGSFSGTANDYTTSFSLQIFSDVTFTKTLGDPLKFIKSWPKKIASADDFFYEAQLDNITGQYVRYHVLTANWVNPGLANIAFVGTPTSPQATVDEPTGIVLFAMGILALLTIRHIKSSATS